MDSVEKVLKNRGSIHKYLEERGFHGTSEHFSDLCDEVERLRKIEDAATKLEKIECEEVEWGPGALGDHLKLIDQRSSAIRSIIDAIRSNPRPSDEKEE